MNGQNISKFQSHRSIEDNKDIYEDEKSVNESDLSYCNRILIQKLAPLNQQKSLKKTSQRHFRGQDIIYRDKSIENESHSEINLRKF